MPKIDPITGCEVMTFFEFLEGEGKREEKDPIDILEEIYKETAEDNDRMSELNKKPDIALQHIKEFSDIEYEDWDACAVLDREEGIEPDLEPYRPEEVLEVIESISDSSYSVSKTFILARVRCIDGIERIAEYNYSYWSGTRINPPEEDGELLWHDSLEEYHSSVLKRKEEELERKRRSEENHQRWLKERKQ